MIKSMTGYGKGEATCQGRKITVEIRSLNSKQVDLNVKSPSIYRHAEQELRNMVSRALVRGKVDLFVGYETVDAASATTINGDAFAGYLARLRELAGVNGIDLAGGSQAGLVSAILRLPDVVSTEVREVTEEETQALIGACRSALSHIEAFRVQEGRVLADDVLGRVTRIEELLAQVEPYEKARVETIRKRIVDTAESLSVSIDGNRLEQELIFYIEKLDVNEEKVRLANHCAYFRQVAAEEIDCGRKLGFIAQEMGREINTLGSKSNNAEMQRIVVMMKDELEKIKEQTLNIL